MKNEIRSIIEHEQSLGEEKELYHINCAECVLTAANEYFKLDLDQKALNAVSGFGGGMYAEKNCGALTGAVAALGILYKDNGPSKNELLKQKVNQMVTEFEARTSHVDCSVLKPFYEDKGGCNELKYIGGEILKIVVEDKD